jgi:hypothetical protein
MRKHGNQDDSSNNEQGRAGSDFFLSRPSIKRGTASRHSEDFGGSPFLQWLLQLRRQRGRTGKGNPNPRAFLQTVLPN